MILWSFILVVLFSDWLKIIEETAILKFMLELVTFTIVNEEKRVKHVWSIRQRPKYLKIFYFRPCFIGHYLALLMTADTAIHANTLETVSLFFVLNVFDPCRTMSLCNFHSKRRYLENFSRTPVDLEMSFALNQKYLKDLDESFSHVDVDMQCVASFFFYWLT